MMPKNSSTSSRWSSPSSSGSNRACAGMAAPSWGWAMLCRRCSWCPDLRHPLLLRPRRSAGGPPGSTDLGQCKL